MVVVIVFVFSIFSYSSGIQSFKFYMLVYFFCLTDFVGQKPGHEASIS